MRGAFGPAGTERQDGLRTFQRLALALLIDAEHEGALGWLEIEPDDIAHLFHEERIGGGLEGFLPVRLQPERAPDPMHRIMRQAAAFSQ